MEYLQIVDNYRKIPTYQELVKIFPAVQKYDRPAGHDIGFILGMIALEESESSPIYCLFGLNLLYEVFDDPSRAGRMKELYGFTRKDFIALTGKFDVFSTEAKSDLYLKLAEMERSVHALTAQWREITGSINWKIVSWISRIGNILAPRTSFRYRILKNLHGLMTIPLYGKQMQKNKHEKSMIRLSGLFDETWYLKNNPDVAAAKIDPLEHYLLFGGLEGRDPGPEFSSRDYLLVHGDIKEAGINPTGALPRMWKLEGGW